MRLGILSSHPIQYYTPWFRALAELVDLEVFYAHRPDPAQQGDGFGKSFCWDMDLLSGYPHRFLKNISPRPDVNHFAGCDTPEIEEIIAKAESGKRKAENKNRFDVFIVVGWYLKSFMQATRACRRAGIPVLVRGDSQLRTPRSLPKRLAMEVRQRWLLRQFDGFLSVGQRHTEYLRHFGVPARKIFSVPHFVDNEFFQQKAETLKSQKAEIRKPWGIPAEAFCVMFCGKFIPKKRPLDLVKAMAIAGGQGSEAGGQRSEVRGQQMVALFVGSGELGPELRVACHVVFDAENTARNQKSEIRNQKFADSHHLSASFTGFKNQSELPACYVAADVLVLPSDGGETWGLVVNEAMACGCPAIVSDAVGCAPDLIEDGRTGFTFPVGDMVALAEKLTAFQQLKERGQDFAPALAVKLRQYSVEAAVAGTLQAVQQCAGGRCGG
jgi:glycosyltransferase involved in cell wall biosynthesis